MNRQAEAIPTDEQLIRRFREGDGSAFDQLVLRHRKDVYRVAYRITGDASEADDLSQETFCRAFTGLSGFRGDASFKTWLLRIVTNLSLNVVQSARLARRDATSVDTLADAGARATIQAPVGLDELLRRERDERLRACIASLPAKQRTTLILRSFEGLPYKEIAAAMGCTIGTAKANFFHAITFLRRRLKGVT